jgi:anti-sigma-K factor RskA
MRVKFNKLSVLAVIASLALHVGQIFAADHAEAPLVESDQAADIAVSMRFLTPTTTRK